MKIQTYKQQAEPTIAGVPSSLEAVRPQGAETLQHGLTSFGAGVDALVERQQRAEHEAAVEDARSKLTTLGDYSTDGLHGSSEQSQTWADPFSESGPSPAGALSDQPGAQTQPTPGFLSLQGKTAVAASATFMTAWDARRKQLEDSISSDTGKRIFRQQSDQLRAGVHQKVEEHVSQQIQVAKADTVKASSDEAVRAAAADPGNDALAAQRIADVVGAAHGMFDGRPEAEQLHEREVQAEVAGARLDNLLAPGPQQDAVKARQVLEQNRGVLGKQLDNYEKAVALVEQKDGAEGLASSIVESARRENGFIDVGKAIAAWTQLPPEKRTKQASEAFDHLVELGKRQEVSVKSDMYSSALGDWLKRHDMNDVNPTTEAWMRANDQVGWDKLEDNARSYKEHKAGTGERADQLAAMGRFLADLRDNSEKYGAMPFAQFQRDVISGLAVKDQKEAYEKFAEAHGQAAKPAALSKEEADMLLEAGRNANLFGPKGKDVSTWTDDQATFYRSAESQLEKRIALEKKQGHKVTTDQVSDWITGIMLKGKVKGRVFDSEKTNLEAGQDPKSKWAPEWTPEQVTRATRALQAAKVPVDNATLDRWLRRKYGLNATPEQAPDAGAPVKKPPIDAQVTDDYGLDLTAPADISPGD